MVVCYTKGAGLSQKRPLWLPVIWHVVHTGKTPTNRQSNTAGRTKNRRRRYENLKRLYQKTGGLDENLALLYQNL